MSTPRTLVPLLSAAAAITIAVSLSAEPISSATRAPRPLQTSAAVAQASPNSVALFKDSDCRKDLAAFDITAYDSNTYHKLPKDCADEISSLRWNLPPGVVVTFYENGVSADNKGMNYSVFGDGELESLDKAELNDKLSCWAWYKI